MFDHYFPSLDAIEDKIQLIQVEVFENPTTDTLDRIFALKKDIMQLRRICLPQREIMQPPGPRRLQGHQRRAPPSTSATSTTTCTGSWRRPTSYQDMVQSTMDAYLSAVSNRLNETMKRLTVIGAMLCRPHRDHRHLRHELRAHAGAAVAVRLLRGAGGSWRALSAALIWWFKKKQWI